MNEEEAVFTVGKRLSELRQSGERLPTRRIMVGSSGVLPTELADEYDKHFPPPPQPPVRDEAAEKFALYQSLTKDERFPPNPCSETDDSLYASACGGFDELITAARAFNDDYVAEQIGHFRWIFISPDSTPKDKLGAVTCVCGGLSRGEWDRSLVDLGGLPHASVLGIPLRFYEYLETLPFDESDLSFVRQRRATYRRSIDHHYKKDDPK